MPSGTRLIEPFVGAGSLFLGSTYSAAILNDANIDLTAVWVAIKERPREFVTQASEFFSERNRSPEAYLRIRSEYNESVDRFERAVRFMYLNKFGFNGLYRVNRQGVFNVPYGHLAALPNFPFDEVAIAAEKLKTATVLSGGFAATMELATAGDVVYCDPPYSDLAAQTSFTGYTAQGFGVDEHMELVAAARQAAARGATVLISNHDTPATRALYEGFEITALLVRRSVAANADRRLAARELVAILHPPTIRCCAQHRTCWATSAVQRLRAVDRAVMRQLPGIYLTFEDVTDNGGTGGFQGTAVADTANACRPDD
jgi:DNA adenine methylase